MSIKHSFILLLFLLTACNSVTPVALISTPTQFAPKITKTVPVIETPIPSPTPTPLLSIPPLTRIGKGAAYVLALSNDGLWLAIGTSLGVYLYETSTQREVWFRAFDSEPHHLAFRPDGAQLAVGMAGNQMPIVETSSGKIMLILTGEARLQGEWSPDGKSILTSGKCSQVLVWDAVSGQVIHTIQPVHCQNIPADDVRAFWSGNGTRIYTLYQSSLSIWDASTYRLLTSVPPSGNPEHSFESRPVASPTENRLAVFGGMGIDILDGETGKVMKTLENNPLIETPFYIIWWSRDGKRVLAADGGTTISIWDVTTGQVLSTQQIRATRGIAFMPDNATLVGVSSSVDVVSAVNLKTGEIVFSLDGFSPGYSVTWDKNDLLIYNGVTLAYWNPFSGQMIEEHASPMPDWAITDDTHTRLLMLVNAADERFKQKLLKLQDTLKQSNITVSPDGKYLAEDEHYDKLPPVIWDMSTAETLFKLDYVGIDLLQTPFITAPLEWSPDGKQLAGGGSLLSNDDDAGFIAIWDMQTGKQLSLLTGGMKIERMEWLIWSPDQRWLAVGDRSGKIFLWNMQTQRLAAILTGHFASIVSFSWSADSTLLASTANDGMALVWKIP